MDLLTRAFICVVCAQLWEMFLSLLANCGEFYNDSVKYAQEAFGVCGVDQELPSYRLKSPARAALHYWKSHPSQLGMIET